MNRNDFSRLCSYKNSYYRSTIKLWNELDPQVRTLPVLLKFKSNIKTIPDKIVDYTSVGEHKCNIILTRIRHRCRSLKADLYSVNIIPSPVFSCGAPSENAEHYFFECRLYTNQRNSLIPNLHTRMYLNKSTG